MSKADIGSLEHPIFPLSKWPDIKSRYFKDTEGLMDIILSTTGMADFCSRDVLIFCLTELIDGRNHNRELEVFILPTTITFGCLVTLIDACMRWHVNTVVYKLVVRQT